MKAKSVNELIGHKKAINGSLIQHLSPRFRSKTHLCKYIAEIRARLVGI